MKCVLRCLWRTAPHSHTWSFWGRPYCDRMPGFFLLRCVSSAMKIRALPAFLRCNLAGFLEQVEEVEGFLHMDDTFIGDNGGGRPLEDKA